MNKIETYIEYMNVLSRDARVHYSIKEYGRLLADIKGVRHWSSKILKLLEGAYYEEENQEQDSEEEQYY